MISWDKPNPQTLIRSLKIPILIVQGKNDIQIAVEDAELLKQASPPVQLLFVDEFNKGSEVPYPEEEAIAQMKLYFLTLKRWTMQ